MQDITRLAIKASLDNNWEEAIDLNLQILANNPDDINALNRLAKAYTELNQKSSAQEIYQRVLSLDKFNPIALRSLKQLPNKNIIADKTMVDEDFIEQIGITKTTKLIKLADKDILLTLYCREPVQLIPRNRLVIVQRQDGTKIGALPDDISLRLKKLLNSNYHYSTCIKSATENTITIFIRETKRPNRNTASPSFSTSLKLKNLK